MLTRRTSCLLGRFSADKACVGFHVIVFVVKVVRLVLPFLFLLQNGFDEWYFCVCVFFFCDLCLGVF